MNKDHSAGEGTANTSVMLVPNQVQALTKWKNNALASAKESYDASVALINKRSDRFEREVKVIQAMDTINTQVASKDAAQILDNQLLFRIEKFVNSITQDNLHNSNQVAVYIKTFGIDNTIELVCEMINYFISSTGGYSKITPVGVMRLANQIVNKDPFFKMVELFMIFRDGVSGELSDKGTNFQKIDIETFYMWVKNHNERMSKYWELQASANKPEVGDNMYRALVDPKVKNLENYRQELRKKYQAEKDVKKEFKK